jgi:hypothetical protein
MSDSVDEQDSGDFSTKLLSTVDVANIFKVDVKTVSRWAKEGGEFERRNVQVLSTIGGHRRFFEEEIYELFQLMLEGKLYREDDRGNIDKTASVSRIVGLPKTPPTDPRLR